MGDWGDFLADLVFGEGPEGSEPSSEKSPEDIPNIRDFDIVEFAELPSETLFVTKEIEGVSLLLVDPENASEENRESSRESLLDGHEETGGFSLEESYDLITAYLHGGKDYVDKLYDFYEGKVPRRFLYMIEESAMLSIAEEERGLSLSEVRQRKEEISKHGHEAYAIASLCSAGYLDEDGIFWQKYEETVLYGSQTVEDYKDAFVSIAPQKPFVVFVKVEDTPTEVYHKALGKALNISDYEWDFEYLDIRGTGERNHETIEDTLDYFLEHHEDLEFEKFEDGRDLVLRFDPETM